MTPPDGARPEPAGASVGGAPRSRPLTVGVDAAAAYHSETGIGRYTVELVRAMAEVDPSVSLALLANSLRRRRPDVSLPGRVVNPRIPARLLGWGWERLGWPPVEALVGEVDVFHTSDWTHPPQRGGVTVSTVHDLGALVHPEWYAPEVVRIHRRKNRAVAEGVDGIVTVSEHTQRTFLSLFGGDPGRVTAVPNGVAPDFAPVSRERAGAARRSVGLERPFLLYVGSWERRKNLLGLIDVFARIAEAEPELTLALVGMRPSIEGKKVHGVEEWTAASTLDGRARELGLEGRVRALGRLPRADLVALYSAAELFLFPSLYEGFGLPVLEAMACGLPVVASSRSAVPEVVGDAGPVADPEDPDAFARAALSLLRDSAARDSARARGIERARSFGWDRTARETLAVYRRTLEAG